mmetsp:Transcript_1855/g.6952  ORF Transcript_1855/g.6952 Transcript_1855/m.6952 type:complete len:100 (+) Transcript_1855:899-1198(+)
MIRKPLGKSRGRDVVLDILQEAVQEYDARQFGSKEDRFRFNPEVKSLLGLAKESAENESKFKQVRYLNREPHFLVSSATLPEPFCGCELQVRGDCGEVG